jgi:formate-dependent nitrite reductase membrane component NrfD
MSCTPPGGAGAGDEAVVVPAGGSARERPAMRRPWRRGSDGADAAGGAQAIAPERDATPAVGTPGAPARWRRAAEGAAVGLHQSGWGDARWSHLYSRGSRYAIDGTPPLGLVAEANRRGRGDGATPELADTIRGPMMKPPVWTWEIPLYFWFGGMAAGSSFVALAADLAGDERSARIARRVALGALAPSPALLIADLGRPERFVNMLRVFKPRSPMSMGAWALTLFANLAAAGVGADLLGRHRAAKRIGAASALVGGYFGSYTGVLLGATAVPVWARSRLLLGPIFVATGALTGAAACRLVLVAGGLPLGHPTREALGRVESAAMVAELALSELNGALLGDDARPLEEGRSGHAFRAAEWLARTGMALRIVRYRLGPGSHHVASVCYLAAALCFRYAWVWAGPPSARDDEAVARRARGQH